jgi:hypothetical protein
MYILAGLKASPSLSAFGQCALPDHQGRIDGHRLSRSLAFLPLPFLVLVVRLWLAFLV